VVNQTAEQAGLGEVDRVRRFLRAADEAASTSVRPFDYGLALFHEGLPRVYDRNFLLVTSSTGPADPRELVAAADELQGQAGLAHRKVVFEYEGVGARIAPGLGAFGWEHRGLAVLAYRGEPDEQAASRASEVDRLALVPAVEALVRFERLGDEDVVRQLARADAALDAVVRQRCFASVVDGSVVAMCRLFSSKAPGEAVEGAVAQVEEVATLPGHRNHGHARAVVSRALAEAVREHDLVFLTAVDGRWVKHWYERLGFEQIGLRYDATLTA
jgi:ribosomal protein S18 acetylase RimI-like enzyme